jgi:hypothetical protein
MSICDNEQKSVYDLRMMSLYYLNLLINLPNQETKIYNLKMILIYFQKYFFWIIIIYLTRFKSKSNVREKRGDGDAGVHLTSFSNSLRRRM